MNAFKIELNTGLFATYVGLTVSGYDLADKNDKDIAELYNSIMDIDWPQNVVDYFAYARTNINEVNPYWPRSSILSSACFFISTKDASRYDTFDDFIQFQRSIGNVSQEEFDDEVINWLKELPSFIDSIMRNNAFDELWNNYQRIISIRTQNYIQVLEKADKAINNFYAHSQLIPPNIVFSPNLLQSPYIADFVTRRNTIIIIKTSPDVLSILHEFIHSVIKPLRDCFKVYIREYDFELMADITKMLFYGYMWNESEESMINALEESFVRGLSIAMIAQLPNLGQVADYIRSEVDTGFKLVPVIAQFAKHHMPDSNNVSDFISGVLDHHVRK